MPIDPEQMKRMPYQETPVGANDVAKEITRLAALVAIIVQGAGPRAALLIEDATKEPGQGVVIQELRLALALESWVATAGMDLIGSLSESLPEALANTFVAMHEKAHG